MSRRWRAMVCLLLCANAATAAGLAAEGAGSAPVPPQESCFEPGTTQRAGPAESRTSDIQVQGEPAECEPLVNPAPGAASPTLADFWGYRSRRHEMNWIVGDGDQFGDFSLRTNTYQPRGIHSGLDPGLEFHFLAGPERTDMPPRVFDFSIGYQKRDLLGNFAYDVAIAVRASSDFEGSAREGIRFPGMY